MARVDAVRSEILKLRRGRPFRPFALLMENGERILVGHPENIAFDPGTAEGVGGSEDYYVISGGLRMFSTLGSITSIAMMDAPPRRRWPTAASSCGPRSICIAWATDAARINILNSQGGVLRLLPKRRGFISSNEVSHASNGSNPGGPCFALRAHAG